MHHENIENKKIDKTQFNVKKSNIVHVLDIYRFVRLNIKSFKPV